MDERKFLKVFFLGCSHQFFSELIHKFPQNNLNDNYYMECYTVDSKIIQFLIHNIVETGEYTLEGIAHHTRIPFDVIFDAACGNSTHISITPWARIVDLYLQVKPEISQMIFDRLLEIKDEKCKGVSLLLNEA